MTTVEQQLFETRKAMLLDRIKGQPASMQQAAVRNLQRMQFEDAADFSGWLNETVPAGTEHAVNQVSPDMQQYLDDRKRKSGQADTSKSGPNIPEGVSPAMRERLIDRYNKKQKEDEKGKD